MAVLDTARALLLANGYGATTIASIAAAADVSVETLYKAFGNKAGLVRAIWDRALAGDDLIPTEQRSDEMRRLEADPRKVIRRWGVFATEVMPRVAPVLLLVAAAAATDPELKLMKDMDDTRRTRMADNARHLFEGGHLRPGITLEQARDVLWIYSAPELYDLIVLRQAWPLEDYGRFVGEAMIAALLPRQS